MSYRLVPSPFLRIALLSLVALLTPSLARAQNATIPRFDLQRLRFDPAALGSLVMGTGRTLPQGMLRVAVNGHYEQLPFHFQNNWEPGSGTGLVENKFSVDVTAAFGVLSWLQVSAELPYIVQQGGQPTMDVRPPDGQGLGSPWLGLRAGLLQQETGFNIAVDVSAALPLGKEELLARDSYAVLPKLQLGYVEEEWQVGAEAGVLLREKQNLGFISKEAKDVIGNELRLGGTVTSRAGSVTRGEVTVLVGLPLNGGGGRMGAELLLAIRRHMASWMDLYVLGGPGVGAGADTPTFRFIAGASFSTGKVD